MNALKLLEQIDRSYVVSHVAGYCGHCEGIKPHLVAIASVCLTGEKVERRECCECHRGDTILIGNAAPSAQ